MRLAEFILANRERILAEWEAFARTCVPASDVMNIEALRDHAGEMLTVIVKDLQTPQGRVAQSEKSKGQVPAADTDGRTAAEQHGAGRAGSGFTVEQMVAEYRALRASVIRLWTEMKGELASADIEDLTRFNEAIDQSLAESVARYSQEVQQSKEMFLAILGHDLRTPLGAIYTLAKFMLESDDLEESKRTLMERIAASATRTTAMVGELLDFTRSRLGGGIPVERTETDMAEVVRAVADEVVAAHPGCTVDVVTRGEQRGEWDEARISQALGNLIGNAVQHSAPNSSVRVESAGDDEQVVVTVHNHGEPIPPDRMDGLFNPMKPKAAPHRSSDRGPTGSLGLGLYIAERIVSAHDGRIDVSSSREAGITFQVYLPRHTQRRA